MRASFDGIERILFSSASSGWAGCPFEIYRLARNGHVENTVSGRNRVALCLAGAADFEAASAEGSHRALLTPGAMVVAGRGRRYASLRWSGSADILLADLDGPGPARRPPMQAGGDAAAFRDARLSSLLFAMARETESGCASGRGYGEALSAALDAYVAAHFRRPEDEAAGSPASSSAPRIARLRDYITANLGTDLSLDRLAGVSRLSPSRVSALFHEAYGCAPHQFVIRARVAEAGRLLRRSSLSIADIAARTGFADQSHFTKTFRRVTATTPKRYRLHA